MSFPLNVIENKRLSIQGIKDTWLSVNKTNEYTVF